MWSEEDDALLTPSTVREYSSNCFPFKLSYDQKKQCSNFRPFPICFAGILIGTLQNEGNKNMFGMQVFNTVLTLLQSPLLDDPTLSVILFVSLGSNYYLRFCKIRLLDNFHRRCCISLKLWEMKCQGISERDMGHVIFLRESFLPRKASTQCGFMCCGPFQNMWCSWIITLIEFKSNHLNGFLNEEVLHNVYELTSSQVKFGTCILLNFIDCLIFVLAFCIWLCSIAVFSLSVERCSSQNNCVRMLCRSRKAIRGHTLSQEWTGR